MKNDFYVYLHKRKDNGEVFYVGKGRKDRCSQFRGRNKAWHELANAGFIIEIHAENLTESEALELELSLIKTLPNLVNYQKKKIQMPSVEDLMLYFKVDRNSPSGLSRIKSTYANSKVKGAIGHCGTIDAANYTDRWVLNFRSRIIKIHIIVWLLTYGTIPENHVIDHIDGNGLNNNIENLRVVSKTLNSRNNKRLSNNTSGVTGVFIRKRDVTTRISFNDEVISTQFSIKKYGQEQAFALACQWREQKIKELNEQGAGYTERHGK